MLWNLTPTTVDVKAKSVTTSSQGNTYAYTTIYSNVPASVQPQGDSLSLYDDGRKVVTQFDVWICKSVTVRPADLLVWQGITMKINYVQNLIEAGIAYRVHATLFTDGA